MEPGVPDMKGRSKEKEGEDGAHKVVHESEHPEHGHQEGPGGLRQQDPGERRQQGQKG